MIRWGLPVRADVYSQEKGVKLKATISEFLGRVLISQICDLNDTQRGCNRFDFPLMRMLNHLRFWIWKIENGPSIHYQWRKKRANSKGVCQVFWCIGDTIMRKNHRAASKQRARKSFLEKNPLKSTGLCQRTVMRQRWNLNLSDWLIFKSRLQNIFHLYGSAYTYLRFMRHFQSSRHADQPKLCLFIDEAHCLSKVHPNDLLPRKLKPS